MSAETLSRWVRRLELRIALDDEERAAILGLPWRHVSLAPNQDLHFDIREPRLFVVEEGFTGLALQASSGVRQLVSIQLPGDLVDLRVLGPGATLTSLAPTCLIGIAAATFDGLIERHPAIGRAVSGEQAATMAEMAQLLLRVGRMPAIARIAWFLCMLANRMHHAGLAETMSFRLPITQQHIGDATGLTAVHVNRTLRELREAGLVHLSHQQVDIMDWTGLQRVAEIVPRDYGRGRATVGLVSGTVA